MSGRGHDYLHFQIGGTRDGDRGMGRRASYWHCPLPNNMALVTVSTWQMDVPETLEAVDGFVGSLSITLSAGGLGDDGAIINEGENRYSTYRVGVTNTVVRRYQVLYRCRLPGQGNLLERW